MGIKESVAELYGRANEKIASYRDRKLPPMEKMKNSAIRTAGKLATSKGIELNKAAKTKRGKALVQGGADLLKKGEGLKELVKKPLEEMSKTYAGHHIVKAIAKGSDIGAKVSGNKDLKGQAKRIGNWAKGLESNFKPVNSSITEVDLISFSLPE